MVQFTSQVGVVEPTTIVFWSLDQGHEVPDCREQSDHEPDSKRA